MQTIFVALVFIPLTPIPNNTSIAVKTAINNIPERNNISLNTETNNTFQYDFAVFDAAKLFNTFIFLLTFASLATLILARENIGAKKINILLTNEANAIK